jgi:hypothetical protein
MPVRIRSGADGGERPGAAEGGRSRRRFRAARAGRDAASPDDAASGTDATSATGAASGMGIAEELGLITGTAAQGEDDHDSLTTPGSPDHDTLPGLAAPGTPPASHPLPHPRAGDPTSGSPTSGGDAVRGHAAGDHMVGDEAVGDEAVGDEAVGDEAAAGVDPDGGAEADHGARSSAGTGLYRDGRTAGRAGAGSGTGASADLSAGAVDADAGGGSGVGGRSGASGGSGGSGGGGEAGTPGPATVTRRRLLVSAVGLGAAAGGGLIAGRLLSSGDASPGGLPGTRPSSPVGGVTSGPSLPAGAESPLPANLLTIYGAPGTFGELGDGQSPVQITEVPGWGFGPGQAAFNSAVSADGTVFISTTPFTDDQSKLTGTDMELEIFEPEAGRFTRLVIPSSKGRTILPRFDPGYRGVGGGDTSDVLIVPGTGDGDRERVVFTSLMPFYGWDITVDGELPSIGQLRRDGRSDQWMYDPRASRTAAQLAAAAPADVAARAFPVLRPLEPRSPRGPSSIARLPRSGHLVIAQYLGTGQGGTDNGALLVIDLDGKVRAHWQYPQVRPLGVELVVNPREVVADPTSEPDDERFVLISDARGLDYSTQPFPIQEFSYSASTGTITPRSTAVRAVQDGSRMESAVFGADGTLYVARTKRDGLSAETLAVYPKLGRERGLVTRTPATGNWPVDTWGIANPPDYLVVGTDCGGLVRSVSLDPKTGAVLLAGLNGLVQSVRPAGTGSRMTFRTGQPIDVGLSRLRGPSTRYVGVRRGSVDAERRSLWLPVNQMVLDGLAWPYPPFKLDQWLLRVDLDTLLKDD